MCSLRCVCIVLGAPSLSVDALQSGALPVGDLLASASDMAASLKTGLGEASGGLISVFEQAQVTLSGALCSW